jgi:hypothetical protein
LIHIQFDFTSKIFVLRTLLQIFTFARDPRDIRRAEKFILTFERATRREILGKTAYRTPLTYTRHL